MWYLPLSRKQSLSSWWAIQKTFLTIFFQKCLQKERLFLKNLHENWVSLVSLQLPCQCWVVFWSNEAEKQSVTIFLWKHTIKGIITWQWPKRKNPPFGNYHVTLIKEGDITWAWPTCSTNFPTQLSFPKLNNLFKLPMFYFNHQTSWLAKLMLSCKTHLYQLCGLWKKSRQLWSIFLVQKWFHLFGRKFWSVRERWQQKIGPKSYNERGRFQPVHALKESASHCSKKLW